MKCHWIVSVLALCLVEVTSVAKKKAFVLLGATGDNAYRPAGVWTGLFEAWTYGVLDATKTDIHVQVNQGHTVDEIHSKVMTTLNPFYETLSDDQSWKCKTT